MSELKVDKVSPRTGNYVALNTVGMKNIVINGDMSIAQRSTSVASISSGSVCRTVDRFVFAPVSAGTWTMSQETDVPTGQGFAKSTKLDCTTADASLSASDALLFEQRFEGQNLQYLKKGTASAESLTLSFWVKSNKTGTYIAEIDDNDNSRNINKSYTINVANTWEKKTITYEGDTTGTLDNDNGLSLRIFWWLAAGTDFSSGTLQTTWGSTVNANRAVGQVNLADNTANEWYITGVQLEAGTTASDFEFLPYDVNRQRCMRYFESSISGAPVNNMAVVTTAGYASSNGEATPAIITSWKVPKRTTPTVTYYAPLTTSPAGKVRRGPTGTISNVTGGLTTPFTAIVGVSSGTANSDYQYGYWCDAEL